MNTRPLPPPSIRWPVPGEIITHGKNAYAVGEALGRGTYGATFACTDQWSNNLVVKVLVPHRQTYEQVRVNWQREIASLFTLRHPNITYVHDAFERDKTFHIVVERCGGSISTLFSIAEYDGYAWIPPIARCMLQAVAFMHEHGYVHKDIHLRNVFWTYVRDELMTSPTQSVTFKIGDLDTKTGKVTVKHGAKGSAKGSKGRTVYLGKATRRCVWRYQVDREDGDDETAPLFVSKSNRPINKDALRQLINALGAKASVKKCYPHRFRHTLAITYLRSGGCAPSPAPQSPPPPCCSAA